MGTGSCEVLIARQPLMTPGLEVVGWEPLYRQAPTTTASEGIRATARIVVDGLMELGRDLRGEGEVYLNVPQELLEQRTLLDVPTEGIVLEVLAVGSGARGGGDRLIGGQRTPGGAGGAGCRWCGVPVVRGAGGAGCRGLQRYGWRRQLLGALKRPPVAGSWHQTHKEARSWPTNGYQWPDPDTNPTTKPSQPAPTADGRVGRASGHIAAPTAQRGQVVVRKRPPVAGSWHQTHKEARSWPTNGHQWPDPDTNPTPRPQQPAPIVGGCGWARPPTTSGSDHGYAAPSSRS